MARSVSAPSSPGRRFRLLDLRDETVALARHGDDVERVLWAVPERLAQQGNVLGEIRFFDEGIGPGGFHQLVFRDRRRALPDQEHQD